MSSGLRTRLQKLTGSVLLSGLLACSGADSLPPHPPPEFGPYALQHLPGKSPAEESENPHPPTSPATNSASLTGTIRLSPELAATLKPGPKIIYLIARTPNDRMPLAVQRLDVTTFPVSFRLSAADAMVPGTQLSGPLQVTARLDADGAAGPPSPGDFEGATAKEVMLGQGNIEILINRKY